MYINSNMPNAKIQTYRPKSNLCMFLPKNSSDTRLEKNQVREQLIFVGHLTLSSYYIINMTTYSKIT